MPVNASLYQLAAYTLPLVAKPIDLCSTQLNPSKVVPITLDWVTFPSFAVSINLNQGTAGTTMDKMVGMYVDNSQNSVALTFICPDTGYRVDCPPGQQRFLPLLTRTNIVNIYNNALSNSLLTSQSNLQVLFTNFVYHPFDTEAAPYVFNASQASTIILGGNPFPRFATDVLGDKHQDIEFDLSNVVISAPFFTLATPLGINGGVLIMTNLQVSIENCYSTSVPISLNMGFSNTAQLGIGTTFTYQATINTDDKYIPFTKLQSLSDRFILCQISGGTLGVPATVFFNSNAIPGGKAYFSFDCAWVGNGLLFV